jgi:hypothetical protein
MGRNRIGVRGWVLALVASSVGVLAGCGSSQPPAAAPAAAPVAPAPTAAAVPVARPLAVNSQTWTPEAMEALLAPIALYPDPVLSQVLIASTNPQEVLDAGNWLIDNPNLADKALDQAAAVAGFTPPMRALMQFRQIVDQMCLKMGWTAELGHAFTNDQSGVLAAVQRLRRQAQDAGNLENSPQMTVATQDQGGQEAIVISPPNPQVVYVPQYDPMTAYAPAPAIEESGYGSGEWVHSGVLEFGAGLIVGSVFDNDADDYYHRDYYYPNYGYGRYPPCPPRYYRPRYGHGYRPGHYYKRPPHYEDTLRDNDFLVVDRSSDEYWSHFDERPTERARADSVPSPIAVARMNRAEPGAFSAEGSAPTRRYETRSGTAERPPGYPAQPPNAGVVGQRPYALDRGPQYYADGQGAQLQDRDREPRQFSAAPQRQARGGDREQPAYEGGRGPRPYERDRGEQRHEDIQGARLQGGSQEPPKYSAAPERHAHGGDREPAPSRDAPSQQHPAQAGPDNRESAQPRLGLPPPPAHSSEGKHGNAGSASRDGGGERAAGPRTQDSTPPASRGNSVVEMQPQR